MSIILTVYNAEKTLTYAINSILTQTWRNIELIAVDDNSSDSSCRLLEEISLSDSRVHVIKSSRNIGAYAARNLALSSVSGDVITCHDADDWSHPSKIERQVRHLYQDKAAVASTSSWIRATGDLYFTRKNRHQRYIQKNPSSVMFRRTVLERVGGWDEVTVGADTEFEQRLKTVYGARSIRHLNEVLAFGLDHDASLSKGEVWRGWLSGDLDAYHRAFENWHNFISDNALPNTNTNAPSTELPRSFPAPAHLLRQRRPSRFDVAMISDFRLYGGSALSLAEEIEAQFRAGLTTAIFQVNCVSEDITGRTRFNPQISQLLHEGKCTLISCDWELEAGCCSMRFPPIFDFAPARVPAINSNCYFMAVNTAPVEKDGTGRMYWTDRVLENMHATFGTFGTWYPIGPRIREYIRNEVPLGVLAADDWVNILDVDSWISRRKGFLGRRPKVGRHSRDDKLKWPTEPDAIRRAYFSDPSWDVRFMGGATCVESLIGKLPSNVEVLPFDAIPVKAFLQDLDFFVYYDNPNRVEAFGRVFIEAIASGCMVILPPYYEPVFGEACIYAEAHEVCDVVAKYWVDEESYVNFVSNAQKIAQRMWSYDTHIERIKALL